MASESAYISYEHYILNIAFMSALAPAAGQRVWPNKGTQAARPSSSLAYFYILKASFEDITSIQQITFIYTPR